MATKRLTEPPWMRNGWPRRAMNGFSMTRLAIGLTFGCLVCVVAVGPPAALAADFRATNVTPLTAEFSAQKKKRPRVTIYPRRVYPGPYAKRQCYSWLVTEYRVSGTVVTPQMRCWWE
jgi:hypothetical protein